jgi:Fanconi anemia group M protein
MSVDERWYGLGDFARLLRLDGLDFREYQSNIIRSVLSRGNSLVVLPTGLGKTFIGAALIAEALFEGKRALLLAPTKPLAEQHRASLSGLLNVDQSEVALLIGSVGKKSRAEMELGAGVIVATPQTIANDLKSGAFSLEGFGVAIFDECHRAVGKYAYTYIANELAVRGILIVGLTASPGSRADRVGALADALNIRHIEARMSTDPDVISYVMPKYLHVVRVEQSARIRAISALLKPIGAESISSLNRMGLLHAKGVETIPRGRLIALGREIDKISAQGYKFGALYSYIRLLNVSHAHDLLVTEGIRPFHDYVDSLKAREKRGRAVENLLSNVGFVRAVQLAADALEKGEEHPKVAEVVRILRAHPGKSAIVFVQYRSTIRMLVGELAKAGLSSSAFVGKKEGVTQEGQKQTLEDFRAGKFRVLVASSIGEEGLDIPSVDLVIFYEPTPNEIRNIQRKGRTGRFRAGDVYVLVAQGTKDEIYLLVSSMKEKRMMALLEKTNAALERRARLEASAKLGQKRLGADTSPVKP